MAGNAFCAFVVVPLFFSLFSTAPVAHAIRLSRDPTSAGDPVDVQESPKKMAAKDDVKVEGDADGEEMEDGEEEEDSDAHDSVVECVSDDPLLGNAGDVTGGHCVEWSENDFR
ncbi:unnamed protein product [Prorocentrum cordatum]|uniref:Uncharacterized protein n=1 Tax=Prorocentrum cordatum TaxID=2364126 RepID=A0ABN9X8D0_9DINO|nr:unnamed protein product [Polarella glacialis]